MRLEGKGIRTLVGADAAGYVRVQVQTVLVFVCWKTQILLWARMPRERRGVPARLTFRRSMFPPLSGSTFAFSSAVLCFGGAQRYRAPVSERVVDRVPVHQLLLGLACGSQPAAVGRAAATVWRNESRRCGQRRLVRWAADHCDRKRVVAGNRRREAAVPFPVSDFAIGGRWRWGGWSRECFSVHGGDGEWVPPRLRPPALLDWTGRRSRPGVGQVYSLLGDSSLKGSEEGVLRRNVFTVPHRRLHLRWLERVRERREPHRWGLSIWGRTGGTWMGDRPDTARIVLQVRAATRRGVMKHREEWVCRSPQCLFLTLWHRRPCCPTHRFRRGPKRLMGRWVQTRVFNILWGGRIRRKGSICVHVLKIKLTF